MNTTYARNHQNQSAGMNGFQAGPDALPENANSCAATSTPSVADALASTLKALLARAEDVAQAEHDAGTNCSDIYLKKKAKIDEDYLKLLQGAATGNAFSAMRRAGSIALFIAGVAIAFISGASWVRWIILSTNDARLAVLLASMVPVTAVGVHFWVWRAHDRSRSHAVNAITILLGLSGVALVGAIAQRYGIDAAISTDGIASLLAGADNRWIMISADLVGVCGSVLLMAWGDEIGKTPAEQLRDFCLRAALDEAALESCRLRRQRRIDRALRKAHGALVKALNSFA